MRESNESAVESLFPELREPRIPVVLFGPQRPEVRQEVELRQVAINEAQGSQRLRPQSGPQVGEVEMTASGTEDESKLTTDASTMRSG